MQHLSNGAQLQSGKYRIERVLGQGGFGITYLARQVALDRKVAIKEFYMKEFCDRDEETSFVTLGTGSGTETVGQFRKKFLKEARNLAKFNHPHIVRVIDVFEENGTAYFIMEYADGGSLSDKVKQMGYLPEPLATRYITELAEALDYIHQHNMMHLDVKPGNAMLTASDSVVLIDFGLSKQYNTQDSGQTSTTPVGISEGYAPMEQYKQNGLSEFSPETDVYALGATFFKLLTGITPPSASDVMEDGLPLATLRAKGVSSRVISIIERAMMPRKRDRFASAREFIMALKGQADDADDATSVEDESTEVGNSGFVSTAPSAPALSTPSAPSPAPSVPSPAPSTHGQQTEVTYDEEPRRRPMGLIIAAVIAVVAVLSALLCFNMRPSEDTPAAVVPADSLVEDSVVEDVEEKSMEVSFWDLTELMETMEDGLGKWGRIDDDDETLKKCGMTVLYYDRHEEEYANDVTWNREIVGRGAAIDESSKPITVNAKDPHAIVIEVYNGGYRDPIRNIYFEDQEDFVQFQKDASTAGRVSNGSQGGWSFRTCNDPEDQLKYVAEYSYN